MPRPTAPSMPTIKQIKDAVALVTEHYPGARIARIGPDGVEFTYPEKSAVHSKYQGMPFGTITSEGD